jgi:hypothetical protein
MVYPGLQVEGLNSSRRLEPFEQEIEVYHLFFLYVKTR